MERGTVLPDRAAAEALRRIVARTRTLFEVRPDGWTEVSADVPFDWEAERPLASPKRFFFPSREPLLSWRGAQVMPAEPEVLPFALFGVHSCDAAAIAYQDRFFRDDPWYQHRRACGFVVTLDCVRACPGGFCREVDAGPFARAGFDLALTPLPDGRMLARAGTPAGEDVIAAAGFRSLPLSDHAHRAYVAAKESAEATFPARPAVARAIARIDARTVADAEWHGFGPACFACTGCTNLCPTCSCFTVVDEVGEGGGTRARHWDSCLLDGFQREASGHHPAPHPGDRVRRFWSHKLGADFAAEFGRLGCVGCGRCDVTCPGSIGALHVLEALGGG